MVRSGLLVVQIQIQIQTAAEACRADSRQHPPADCRPAAGALREESTEKVQNISGQRLAQTFRTQGATEVKG